MDNAAPVAVPNELSVVSSGSPPGSQDTLSVALSNATPISGLQLDLQLPPELSPDVDGIFLTDRQADHTVSAQSLPSGAVRVLAFSNTLAAFDGEEGPVVQVPLTVEPGAEGTYAVGIESAVLSDTTGSDVTTGASGGAFVARDTLAAALGAAEVETAGSVPVESTAVAAEVGSVEEPGLLVVGRYDAPPSGAGGIEEANMSQYRWRVGALDGLAVGGPVSVRFAPGSVPDAGIGDPSEVVVYRRGDAGEGPFVEAETSVDAETGEIVAEGLPGFGEFVFASDSEPLPVEIVGFDASAHKNEVHLTWRTLSETRNDRFEVERKGGSISSWNRVASVNGNGTTNNANTYHFTDTELPFEWSKMTYRLKQVDMDGKSHRSKPITVERHADDVRLVGVYPNPTDNRAVVQFSVSGTAKIKITLHDELGRQVQTVARGWKDGHQSQLVDVSNLSSGTYFLRLRVGGQTKHERVTVVQ